jgi:nucleotide-binding universal stress UspA family protein
MNHTPEHDGRIVVGVDGSACSDAALTWAVAQARLTGGSIEAVNVWQLQPIYGLQYGLAPALYEADGLAGISAKILEVAIAAASPPAELPVVTRVIEGNPAGALIDAAKGAQLLVVGCRGHNTLAGLLLGSVSQHCVQHAPCPVVVVRS